MTEESPNHPMTRPPVDHAGDQARAGQLLDAAEWLEKAIVAAWRQPDFDTRNGRQETPPPTKQEVSA